MSDSGTAIFSIGQNILQKKGESPGALSTTGLSRGNLPRYMYPILTKQELFAYLDMRP
jgi:hypothetical protein